MNALESPTTDCSSLNICSDAQAAGVKQTAKARRFNLKPHFWDNVRIAQLEQGSAPAHRVKKLAGTWDADAERDGGANMLGCTRSVRAILGRQ